MDVRGGRWAPLIVISIAVFILVIDTTMMNVSISALILDLGSNIGEIQGVIAIYALIMASFMLLGGRIGDIMGRRKVFLIGLALYGVGTLIASFAWDVTSLLIGWSVLEGLGAAFMMPATAVFITESYTGEDRAKAFGVWGGVASFGAAIGPIVGGTLTTYASWRWAFRLELVFVIMIFVMIRALPEGRPTITWAQLDTGGAVTSIVSMALIVLGILIIGDRGMPYMGPMLILSGIAVFVYLIRSRRRMAHEGRDVIFDPDLLYNRVFTIGTGLATMQNLVLAGFLFVLPIFLQGVTGISAFMTGVTILPMSLLSFIVSTRTKALFRIGPPRVVIAIGMLCLAIGAFLMRLTLNEGTTMVDLLPGSLIFGAGVGIVLAQVTNVSLSSVGPSQSSDASGLHNSFKQLGTSLGTAIIGLVLVTIMFSSMVTAVHATMPNDDVTRDEVEQMIWEWIDTIKQGESPDLPPEIADELPLITSDAFIDGSRSAFDAIAITSLLGAALALSMPRRSGH